MPIVERIRLSSTLIVIDSEAKTMLAIIAPNIGIRKEYIETLVDVYWLMSLYQMTNATADNKAEYTSKISDNGVKTSGNPPAPISPIPRNIVDPKMN